MHQCRLTGISTFLQQTIRISKDCGLVSASYDLTEIAREIAGHS